jgi:hypothetical protein
MFDVAHDVHATAAFLLQIKAITGISSFHAGSPQNVESRIDH